MIPSLSSLFGSASAVPVVTPRDLALQAETSLLNLGALRHGPLADNFITRVYDVVAGQHSIHTIEVSPKPSSPPSSTPYLNEDPVVILHGYGNGLGYLWLNLLPLATGVKGRTVFGIDMLGFGLSSRPPFSTTNTRDIKEGTEPPSFSISTKCNEDKISGAEDFFVDSLELWRKNQGIEKMVLCGHSLGGYLSVAYTERYPERVSKLCLLSPVGVLHIDPVEQEQKMKQSSWRFRALISTVRKIWSFGYTPMSILRVVSEARGIQIVNGYIYNRLKVLDPEEKVHLASYFYNINVLPPSGENCLNHLLHPGAMAKRPLIDRIKALEIDKVAFVYGQHDWMDVGGGLTVQDEIIKSKTFNKDLKAPDIEVSVVENAGHLLMIENHEGTNEVIIDTINGKVGEKVVKIGDMVKVAGKWMRNVNPDTVSAATASNRV